MAPDVFISPINPLIGIDVIVVFATLFESNPSNFDIFVKDKKYCLGEFEMDLKYPAVLSNVILPPLEKDFSMANGATVWLWMSLYQDITFTPEDGIILMGFTKPVSFIKRLRLLLPTIFEKGSS